MSLDRMGLVMEISVPIFALILLGAWLRKRKILSEEHLGGINWILFNLSLPALLLRAIAPQDFSSLFNPAIIVGALLPIAIIAGAYFLLAKLSGINRPLLGPFVAGTFWANSSYMGFPLAHSAFGEVGLVNAAMVNAFVMPAYLSGGIILYSLAGKKGGHFSWATLLKSIFNPVINSVILGLMLSAMVGLYGPIPIWMNTAAHQVDRILAPLGQMGLPLALLCVGASLRFEAIHGKWGPLCLSIVGKLVLIPTICYLIFQWGFPEVKKDALGVAVLITATPCSVASWIISRKMDVEPDFVSAQMVLSTMLSVVSLPLWLYVLL